MYLGNDDSMQVTQPIDLQDFLDKDFPFVGQTTGSRPCPDHHLHLHRPHYCVKSCWRYHWTNWLGLLWHFDVAVPCVVWNEGERQLSFAGPILAVLPHDAIAQQHQETMVCHLFQS